MIWKKTKKKVNNSKINLPKIRNKRRSHHSYQIKKFQITKLIRHSLKTIHKEGKTQIK